MRYHIVEPIDIPRLQQELDSLEAEIAERSRTAAGPAL